jgi:hypothetical protein
MQALELLATERKMRKPTLKQRRFIKAYVQNGGNATQAAWVAYDTEDYDTAPR